ncbi:hypothetical protein ACGFZU_35130 [Streptomyces tendae]|uniref:hypothetical protein n=1 Tax=Streptomyces tendae TaxID=1932 RepID=UPI00371B6B91
MQISQRLADEFNRAARFLPQVDGNTKPCVEIGGMYVFLYLHPVEGLCFSVDRVPSEIPEVLRSEDGTVPVRIDIDDEQHVFTV